MICLSSMDIQRVKLRWQNKPKTSKNRASRSFGRYFRPARPEKNEKGFELAVDATLRAAVLRQAFSDGHPDNNNDDLDKNGHVWNNIRILPNDLRKKVRKQIAKSLMIFLVDASDSMGSGTEARMKAAKGAILALLSVAYQQRNKVALVVFQGEKARLLLPPTFSILLAREKLKGLPTGGATPFSDGLSKAWHLVKLERAKSPDIHPVLIIISDGEANVPLQKGQSPIKEVLAMGKILKHARVHSIVIDTNRASSKDLRKIAYSLGAEYHQIHSIHASSLLNFV